MPRRGRLDTGLRHHDTEGIDQDRVVGVGVGVDPDNPCPRRCRALGAGLWWICQDAHDGGFPSKDGRYGGVGPGTVLAMAYL